MSLQNVQADIAEMILSEETHLGVFHPLENIEIYHDNLIATLLKALKHTFPMVEKIVGDKFFAAAAREYTRHYPSRNGNLNVYGEYFSDFLLHYPPAMSLIYLSEVATIEWAVHTLYHAAEHAPLSFDELENLNPGKYDELTLVLHPATRLVKCQFPMLEIMELCEGKLDKNIDLSSGGVNLLITRPAYEIQFLSLAEDEFTFLNCLHHHISITDALDQALAVNPAFDLMQHLIEWVNSKLIVEIKHY